MWRKLGLVGVPPGTAGYKGPMGKNLFWFSIFPIATIYLLEFRLLTASRLQPSVALPLSALWWEKAAVYLFWPRA